MSDCKCEHNNHSHFLLWMFMLCFTMNSCVDCSGEKTRMENQIRQLQSDVSYLKANQR